MRPLLPCGHKNSCGRIPRGFSTTSQPPQPLPQRCLVALEGHQVQFQLARQVHRNDQLLRLLTAFPSPRDRSRRPYEFRGLVHPRWCKISEPSTILTRLFSGMCLCPCVMYSCNLAVFSGYGHSGRHCQTAPKNRS